jgi:hypothetical protein
MPTLTLTLLPSPSPTVRLSDATWVSTRSLVPLPSAAGVQRLTAGFGAEHETEPVECPPGGWVLVEVGCEGRGCRVEYRLDDDFGKLYVVMLLLYLLLFFS